MIEPETDLSGNIIFRHKIPNVRLNSLSKFLIVAIEIIALLKILLGRFIEGYDN
jgi:hypothetical protein